MWAAQALGPSSDWGSCRLGPPGARPTDEAGRAAAGLADSKGLRRRRQRVQEAPSFLSQKLGPSIQEVQREGGTCPACLREKLRSGPHQRPTKSPNFLCRWARGAVQVCSPASGRQASGGAHPEVPLCSGFPDGLPQLPEPIPEVLPSPRPPPHTIPLWRQWLGGTLRGSPGLKDDQGPRIHSWAMLVA